MKNNKGKKAKRVCSALLAGGLATCTAASFLPATASADSISVSPSGDVKANTGISSGSEDSNKMSYSEASERFSKIQMANSITGGDIHLSFSYASTPMVTLTNQPLGGYEFVKYIITDDSGNTVSRDDLCNLNFTGEVKVGAQFKKKASETEQENTEKQQKLEEMKSRAKLIKSGTSTGGNVNISIDYTQDPPVRLNASPYDGYKFSSYVIKDEDGNDVSLGDLENLNITEKVYVSGIFTKVSSGSTDTGGTTKVDDSDKGISYSEALKRYNSITTPQSVTGGTFHVGFNYDSTPMITLTESAYDGYKFKGYVITDDSGKTVSMNDLLNLNFTGNVNLTAEFEKTSTSSSSSDKESEKEALEKKKAAFKLLAFKNAEGGNIGVTVNYESDTPVTVTNTPADGYTFDKYVITDSDGNVVLLDDVEKLNITKATTVTPVFKKTGGGSSGSSSSTGTVIKTNHGLTSAQAVERYNNIEMLNSKNGTYHMTFNFSSQPMITLTNTPYDGCTFSKYVIRDADGNDISLDDFVNLQFTGKATITAEFTKPASSTDAETEEEKAKKKYEELKEKFNLLSFKSAEGGNISAAFDYTATPPVTVTETPASGYKFVKYVIKNAGDEDVSLDDVENLNISSKTTVTPVFEKTSASGGSSGGSTSTEPAKNAGLTASQALARYDNIEMLAPKNGTYHMSFSFSNHPMITLINTAYDGYTFSKYVIKDVDGKDVSLDDFVNLQFTGKVTITAEFTKNSSDDTKTDTDEAAEKAKYEALKTKFKLLTFKSAKGGNVNASFDYTATPPVNVTETPADGYKFVKYEIKDADGKDVSLDDVKNLNIISATTVTPVFEKTSSSGGSPSGGSTSTEPIKNAGLTFAQALARYDNIEMLNSKNGTYHMSFNFSNHPIVTLTNTPFNGYTFSKYVIKDVNGKEVSLSDFQNLQFTDKITITAEFTKNSSDDTKTNTDEVAEKAKYEALKTKFKLLTFKSAEGGNVNASFDYTATPPVSVTEEPADGYEFVKYEIKDAYGKDVSLDDVKNLNIISVTTVTPVFEKTGTSGGSSSGGSTSTEPIKNAGLTSAQALARYEKIEMLNSKNGTYHMSFNFSGHPMITLTNAPFDGYKFSKYVITDEAGREVSFDDFCNLNFDGKVKITAEFTKDSQSSDSDSTEEAEKKKYEELKTKFKEITVNTPTGGNVYMSFNYSATPPAVVTNTPASGYTFDSYVIKDANGNDVSLGDLQSLNISGPVTLTAKFTKIKTDEEKKEEEANKPKTNHGLTAEQALARYNRMLLANTKNGTLHAHFDFEKTPMVTLTPEADDGYVFSQFVITDENGNTVSEDNAKNLQYTGSITVQTIFRKKDTTSEKEPSKSDTDAEKQKYTKLKNKFGMIHFSQAVGGSISAKFDYTATPPLSVSEVTFEGYTFKGYSIKDEDGNDVSFDDLQNLNITKKVNVSGIFEKKASDASQTTISSDTKNADLTYAQALERYKKIKLPDSIKGGTVHLSFDFTKTPMITLTETPEDGYVFDKFSITDENGKGVSTDDLHNLNFTGTVTVSAVFEKKEERRAKEQAAKEKEKYDWYKEKFDMLTFKRAVGGDLHVKFDYSATPPLTLTPSAYKGYKFDTYKLTYANGHTANLEDVLDLDIQSKVTVQPVFVKLNSASETVTVSSKTKSATAKKTSPSKTSTTKTVTSKTSSKSTSKTASKKTSTKKTATKKTSAKKSAAKSKAKKTTKKTTAKKSSAKKSSSSQVLTISSSSSRSKKRTSAPSITVTMKGRVITYRIKNVKASEHVEVQFRKSGSSSWKAASDRNLRKMTNGTYYFRARIVGRGYKSSWSAAKTITRNVPTKHKSKKK